MLAAATTVIVVIFTSGGAGGHQITVTIASATDMASGQWIRSAGQVVGSVDSIEAADGGRKARLTLTVDDSAWPLPRGTTMALRWGGTVSFVNRYIELVRGPTGAPPIAQDGVFPSSSFNEPVEFDQFLGTFTAPVRADLKHMLDDAGVAFHTAQPNLERAIDGAPAALTQTSYVLQDLDANEAALNTLVRSGSEVVGSVHSADPGLAPLVSAAASTFGALASRAQALQSTLDAAPGTFLQARSTLAQAQPTLGLAQQVTGRIAPGVDQVHRLAAPLDKLLVTLRNVGPSAIQALAAARAGVPSLNQLLVKATKLMPEIGSIGAQSVHELQCIRPYTPDIVGFTSDWGDFMSSVDGKDHVIRAQVQTLVPAPYNAAPYDSAQLAKLAPWISYVFPPPPGYAAGQPWFLPQCNEGPDTLNPDDDPENNGTAAELPPASSSSAQDPK